MSKWMYTAPAWLMTVLVFSTFFAHGMEKEVKRRHITSLKRICCKYIGAHPDEVKILDNLADFPSYLACRVLFELQTSYLPEHKETCISLIQSLDHNVASIIVSNLCGYKIEINRELSTLSASTDEGIKRIKTIHEYNATICLQTLVRELIKKGPLVPYLACLLYEDFFDAEIPDDFDDLFNTYFPANITYNNEELLYSTPRILVASTLQKSNNPFSVQEFENQIPARLKKTGAFCYIEITCANNKKYKSIISPVFFDQLQCNTILKRYLDLKHNILLLHYEQKDKSDLTFIKLLNLTTLLDVDIRCPQKDKIQKIGFNSDCSQVAYMKTDGTICSYSIPKEFIYFVPSFKHRAFLAYVFNKWRAVLRERVTLNTHMNLSRGEHIKASIQPPLVMMRKLLSLIEKNEHRILFSPYETEYKKAVSYLQLSLSSDDIIKK